MAVRVHHAAPLGCRRRGQRLTLDHALHQTHVHNIQIVLVLRCRRRVIEALVVQQGHVERILAVHRTVDSIPELRTARLHSIPPLHMHLLVLGEEVGQVPVLNAREVLVLLLRQRVHGH